VALRYKSIRSKGFTLLEVTIAVAVMFVVISGILIGVRGNNNADYRALEMAALTFQADMRYIQRRAVIEGRTFEIRFDPAHNRYTLHTTMPFSTIRTVNFEEGINLLSTTAVGNRSGYTPRGNLSGASFTITLTSGVYTQPITTTVSGGQVIIHDRIREVSVHDSTRQATWHEELHGGFGS